MRRLFAMIKLALSEAMGKRRVTQKELSEATGIRQNTINDMYHNVTDRVSLEYLDRICEALNCELWDIIKFKSNDTRTVRTANQTKVYKSKD